MKLPFECLILDDAPVEVTNPFSGESCMLTPEAVAVYDSIKGAEMIGDWRLEIGPRSVKALIGSLNISPLNT